MRKIGFKERIKGPRIPPELLARERKRFFLPTSLLSVAAIILTISLFFPYWHLKLMAPQYPQGLKLSIYVNRLAGDINEIDALNHHIGMKSLKEGGQLEMSISIIAIVIISLLVLASSYVHSQFAVVLSLPALIFPLIFLGDLFFWLYDYGHNLDPHAPIKIKPFIPKILGTTQIAQFKTVATWGGGLWMAIVSSILILIGLYLHRKAYKSLVNDLLGNKEH